MVNCAVYMCKRRSKSSNLRMHNISYHKFPRDPSLRQEWKNFCNRSSKWNPTRTSAICSDHFTPSSFKLFTNIRRILNEGAKPTLRPCYCSKTKEDHPNSSTKCRYVTSKKPTPKDAPNSEFKLKTQINEKNKKIRRLRDNNRSLRKKLDNLQGMIDSLHSRSVLCKKVKSDVSEENYVSEENDVTEENEMKKKEIERSRKMSNNQDETVLSNDFGLAECRTCLQALDKNSILVDLFQCWVPPWDGMESTIAEDLAKLANVQITQTDRYSKVICEPCCLKLQSACDFACIVRKNDRLLQKRYPQLPEEMMDYCNGTVWPKPIQLDKNITGVFYDNVMDIEIKQEALSGDEYENNSGIEDSREGLASLEIKIEPEELMQPIHVQVHESVEQTEDSQSEETQPYAVLNGHIFHDTKEDIPLLTNGIDSKEDVPIIKEEPMSDVEDGEATPTDLSLECMLCCKEFNCVTGLKAHVIAQHSYKSVKRKTDPNSPEKKQRNPEFVCGTCQRRFTTSTDLMVHETCHNKTVCYACSEKFDSFEQLTKHSRKCKAIANKELQKPKTLEDLKRPIFQEPLPTDSFEIEVPKKLNCSICNEEFSDIYYLTIHEEIFHSSSEEVRHEGDTISDMQVEMDNLKSVFGSDN